MQTTHFTKSALAFLALASVSAGCMPSRGTMPEHTWHPDDSSVTCADADEDITQVARWSVDDRAALISKLEVDEIVVVSALGCDVEVLPQCRVEGSYRIASSGRRDIDRGDVNAAELNGACAWATHAITAVTFERDRPAVADLTPLSLEGFDVTGLWQGVMRQPGGPYEVYNVVLELEQTGSRVSGVSHLETVDDRYWGALQFEGRIEGNTMFFADALVIDDNSDVFANWCMKGGFLVVDPRDATVRGPWRASMCAPGELELQQHVRAVGEVDHMAAAP